MNAGVATELAALARAVQRNCDIADARHAGELTLCTYLLQMREFYRWEHGAALDAALPREAVGAWIAAREAHWSALDGQPWQPLSIAGRELDPMDAAAANRALAPFGLLYGAGLVVGARPVFFLAELHSRGQREGLAVEQGAREHARGLAAPPAALAGGGAGPIVVRRDALARWCSQRLEAWRLHPAPGSAMDRLVRALGIDDDAAAGLERWLELQVEVSVLHELGERSAGRWLGPHWDALRAGLPTRAGAIRATALRDLLADLRVTLPTLLERGDATALDAWRSGFDGARAALWPLAARSDAGGADFAAAAERARRHFEALARAALALHEHSGDGAAVEAALGAPAAVCA